MSDVFNVSLNARDWAKAFVADNPKYKEDEELLVTWFANAIMRGWDEHACRTANLVDDLGAPIGSQFRTYSKDFLFAARGIAVEIPKT